MKEKNDICLSILLAMDTGMMIGEMCALKVSDIDLDKQLIHISKRAQGLKMMKRDLKLFMIFMKLNGLF